MLNILHTAGFFSCCSVRLSIIIKYYNDNNILPNVVNSSKQFIEYKLNSDDITFIFFQNYNNIDINIDTSIKKINYDWNVQYTNYKTLEHKNLYFFIKKYFSPSNEILNITDKIISEYNIIPENYIALYFRGTDKKDETKLGDFDTYYNKLLEVLNIDNNLKILIQTDSAQFIDYLNNKNIKFTIIKYNSVSYKDRGLHHEKTYIENHNDIKYLFATFLIISKCKYIICNSCNGSLWIMHYRENSNNIYQCYNNKWL
jgi:hypothetical protein